jgi:hypothetical protein
VWAEEELWGYVLTKKEWLRYGDFFDDCGFDIYDGFERL